MKENLSENTKDKIMECSLKLFAEKGYNGVGVQELAESSGITKPTLYYFFGNKEGLFNAIWERNFSILQKNLVNVAKYKPYPEDYFEDVFPQLCKIVDVFSFFASDNPVFYQMYLSSLFIPSTSTESEVIAKYIKIPTQIMKSFFEDVGKSHGNVKGKEKLLSWSFLSLVHMAVLEKIESADIVKQFMHGIFS